jgi:hypothetical protein
MKRLLTAITLTMAANSVFAGGFSPWDDRDVAREAASSDRVATVPAGFAPWRDRDIPMDVIDGQVRVSENYGSTFRPWS